MTKAENEIKAEACVPENFRKDAFYRIPRYQRPYTWSKDEVLKLLVDVYKYYRTSFDSKGSPNCTSRKFIGAMILIKDTSDPHSSTTIFDVIDGQQRLTTLHISFYAISLRLVGLVREFLEAYAKIPDNAGSKKRIITPLNIAMTFTLNRAKNAGELVYRYADGNFQPLLFREDSDGELTEEELVDLGIAEKKPSSYASDTPLAFKNLARLFKTRETFEGNPGAIVCNWNEGILNLPDCPKPSWSGTYQNAFEAVSEFLTVVESGLTEESISSDKSGAVGKKRSCQQLLEDEDISSEVSISMDDCLRWLEKVYNKNRFELNKIKDAFDAVKSLGTSPEIERCLRILKRIMRLSLFKEFLARNVSFVSITCSTHEALDIFQTVNTAGKPLTCIETFLPEAYRLIERCSLNDDKDKTFINGKTLWGAMSLEGLLKGINDLCSLAISLKPSCIPEIVTMFALVYNGKKCGSSVLDQRRYLTSSFRDIVADLSAVEQKDFDAVHKYILTLYLVIKWWLCIEWGRRKALEFKPGAPDNKADADLADRLLKEVEDFTKEFTLDADSTLWFCLVILRESNFTLPLAILCRFYLKWEANRTKENAKELGKAAQALLSFATLWHSVTVSSSSIAEPFRAFLSGKEGGVKGHAVTLCSDEKLFVADLQQHLWGNYIEKKNTAGTLELWQEGLAGAPVAHNHKSLTRFLMLVYMEYSEFDANSPIGVRKEAVRQRPNTDTLLRIQKWADTSALELEHIVPQSHDTPDWSHVFDGCKTLADEQNRVNQLGNVTFLPKVANILASNSKWDVKRTYYAALSDNGNKVVEKIIQNQSMFNLKQGDITKLKRNRSMLEDAERTDWVAGFDSLGAWDNTTIKKRTDAIAQIVWPRLCEWLGKTGQGGAQTQAGTQAPATVSSPASTSSGVASGFSNGSAEVSAPATVSSSGKKAPRGKVLHKHPVFQELKRVAEEVLGEGAMTADGGLEWVWGEDYVRISEHEDKIALTLSHKSGFRIRGGQPNQRNPDYVWLYEKIQDCRKRPENLGSILKRWLGKDNQTN